MSPSSNQPPGIYAPFEPTDVLLVGPHNLFTRNGVTFNDRQQLECFWVDDMSGFDSPDINVSATPNVQETGESPDPGLHGGRTMTLTGWIQAGSYPTLMKMGRMLLDSLIDLVEMPMQITTAVGGTIFAQAPVTIDCRPADKVQLSMQVQPGDIQGTIKRNFTIALRASDPTFKSVTETYAMLMPTIVSIPGRPYDRIYDISYTDLLDAEGSIVDPTALNVVTVTNSGNWNASARIRVTGPMSSVVVLNQTTGQVMYFTNVDAGDYIEVDTHPRRGTVTDQDGALRSSLLDPRSDWMWLQGVRNGTDGTNTIALFVDDYDTGAMLEFWFSNTSI